jgi:hypothetical protein
MNSILKAFGNACQIVSLLIEMMLLGLSFVYSSLYVFGIVAIVFCVHWITIMFYTTEGY